MFKRVFLILCGGLATALYFSCGADAAETIKPAGPIGGTDISEAFLPPPGLYVEGVGVGFNLPVYWTADDTLSASGRALIGGAGLLYVYDTEVFGGSLASSGFDSYERTCFGIKPLPESCSSGMGDVYSDVLMWSRFFPSDHFAAQPKGGIPIRYGLQILVGLGVTFPTGNYDASRHINNGSNVFDIAPNVALTYTTPSIFGDEPGHATEFSARFFLNNYLENTATHYQTGRIASLDFAVTERVNQWQFGLAGTTFAQFEDDEIAGVKSPNDGNRATGLALGPVISYDFLWKGRPWNLRVKGNFAVTGQNIAPGNGFVLKLATQLF